LVAKTGDDVNRFSHRQGVVKPPELSADEMSSELQTALWNVIHPLLFDEPARLRSGEVDSQRWRHRLENVYQFIHWRVNELTYIWSAESNRLQQWFFHEEREWYEIYDLVDFIARLVGRARENLALYQRFNQALQTEGSPYRFVEGVLTQIVDPIEIASIESALHEGDSFSGARAHIVRAMELIAHRPQPDYRNSIKEAISAVESTLKILTGKDHADLSEALKDFQSKHPIHGALFTGLDKLYGYTSNEHGLRHALLDAQASVGYAEAKFMIVACAAFMNYLIARTAP
jgi:hypothetical protein